MEFTDTSGVAVLADVVELRVVLFVVWAVLVNGLEFSDVASFVEESVGVVGLEDEGVVVRGVVSVVEVSLVVTVMLDETVVPLPLFARAAEANANANAQKTPDQVIAERFFNDKRPYRHINNVRA